jgi:TRAP-type mannitol/chloroaromatic compound transport system permease small subunit
MSNFLSLPVRLVSFIGIAAAVVLLPLLIGVRVYEIVMRKLLSAPSAFLQFVEWEAFTLLVLLSLGFAYVRNAHVRVDILRDRLRARPRVVIELIGYLVFMLPFGLVVIVTGFEYAADSFETGERAALAFGRPFRWVLKGSIAFGVGLFLIAATVAAIRNVRFIIRGRGGPSPDDGFKG